MFVELGDYEDSATMVKACDYAQAVKLYNSGDYESAISIFKSIEDYEDSDEYIENAEYKIIINDAGEGCVIDAWEYLKNEGCLKDFVDKLSDDVEDNAFAKKLCELYEELDIANQSDFVRDYLDFYNYARYQTNYSAYPRFKAEEVTNVFVIGYDENNNVVNGADKIYLRTIFANVFETAMGYNIYKYTDDEGFYHGILVRGQFLDYFNKESGIWNEQGWYEQLDGTPYKKIDSNELQRILTENAEILNLIEDAYTEEIQPYLVGEVQKSQEQLDAKNAEPEIGMTKDEVINGAWGEPDKKNIDEYESGTKEQWVYDGKGYVYFEDGIVTSIQHRD